MYQALGAKNLKKIVSLNDLAGIVINQKYPMRPGFPSRIRSKEFYKKSVDFLRMHKFKIISIEDEF